MSIVDSGIPRTFDHLVIAVPDLAAGAQEFEELTGVISVPGGSHPGRGTANHLVPLVPRGWDGASLTYLEILGPDPEQDPQLAAASLPGVTGLCAQRWAVHPDDFDATVASAGGAEVDYGRVFDMSRNTLDGGLLEWRLTRRTPLAFGGAQPFLIDWGTSAHPAEALRAGALRAGDGSAQAPGVLSLDRLEFFGPNPDRLSEAVGMLAGERATAAEAAEPGFRAILTGPRGQSSLSSPISSQPLPST